MRALRVLGVQLRSSLLVAMQYRSDFLVEGGVEVLWALTALTPLVVVYGQRPAVAGWSFPEATVVVGWFTLLQGVLEGAINPSMTRLVEHVRKGTLDFLLVKPADVQLLVSAARIEPWKSLNVLVGLLIVGWGLWASGHAPTAGQLTQGGLMLGVSLALLYSLWMVAACAAFVLGKVDNLTYLFSSVFDAARWPSSVFPALLRLFFTLVVPLAVMTTFPAEALLGRLPADRLALACGGALAALGATRWLWLRSVSRYTSAGG